MSEDGGRGERSGEALDTFLQPCVLFPCLKRIGTIGGLVHDAVPLTMLLGLGAMNQEARDSIVRQASTKDGEHAEITMKQDIAYRACTLNEKQRWLFQQTPIEKNKWLIPKHHNLGLRSVKLVRHSE